MGHYFRIHLQKCPGVACPFKKQSRVYELTLTLVKRVVLPGIGPEFEFVCFIFLIILSCK